jgi:serine/threonine-protein kinase
MHLLKHRYQILQVLSEAGGFGQTFLAEDTDTPSRRRCVIKKLRPIADPQDFKFVQERFQREAAILERLGDSSDQIPKLYAYFVENQEFYLVQELIEGLTLRQKVRQEGALSEGVVRELLVNLLSVLVYVHEQKIIHRDIKPDNIIIRRRDNKPVLIDFGIVKEVLRVSADGGPTSSVMAGTPGYTSLEQAAGRPVFASDLYSLGATAIFLLTGKNPQQMVDPVTGRINWQPSAPGVSPALAAILDKATEAHTRDRYHTAGQVREDLLKAWRVDDRVPGPRPPASGEEETVVRPAPAPPPPPGERKPNYALYFGVAATVLGLLAVIGLAAVLISLNTKNREGEVAAKDEPSTRRQLSPVETPGPTAVNRAGPAETTPRRPAATPPTTSAPLAAPAPTAPTPTPRPPSPVVVGYVPGRFPEASTRLLTASDLSRRTPWELRIMRNEIFARHGYIFKTPDMRSYFAQQPWYSPRHHDVSSRLSAIETRNLKMIKSSE